MSKKRKFVADGVFYAELNELFTRELSEEGYSGMEVRVTPERTEIIIRATRTQDVLGEKGQRIRELTSIVQRRCVEGGVGWHVWMKEFFVAGGEEKLLTSLCWDLF
jgi:ribosomal protein S3